MIPVYSVGKLNAGVENKNDKKKITDHNLAPDPAKLKTSHSLSVPALVPGTLRISQFYVEASVTAFTNLGEISHR